MKRLALILALVFVVAVALPAVAGPNGRPNGSHYNLNLLAHQNCPGDDLRDTNGHTIFFELGYSDTTSGLFSSLAKKNKVFLSPGEDFEVTDRRACDNDGARFTLPTDVATTYTVWAAELGKPTDASSWLTLCAEDPDTGEIVCAMNALELKRYTGKPNWRNVTNKLLYLDGVPLFDATYQNYFWDYDNHGLRLAQLRFYPNGD